MFYTIPTKCMKQDTKNSPVTKSRDSEKQLIIITGSSGLIGTHIIKRLSPYYSIVGLDKEGNPYPPAEAESVTFDITDPGSIKAALERVRNVNGDKIASVIHLAAYYDFSGAPSPLYEEVTVKGTEKFIDALRDFQVEQFIFSSTNLIYKPTEPGKKINEDAPLAPNWDYPESK